MIISNKRIANSSTYTCVFGENKDNINNVRIVEFMYANHLFIICNLTIHKDTCPKNMLIYGKTKRHVSNDYNFQQITIGSKDKRCQVTT